MKKHIVKSLLVVSLIAPIFSAGAATYSVGNFYVMPENPAVDYSIDTSGVFWDEFDFYTRAYSYRDSTSMTFSGSHSGMFNDELLLINLNTRETYSLEDDFSITVDNLRYNQRFAITGAGLNASDPTVLSNYTLSLDAVLDPYTTTTTTPNPVPLPATAWLFVSGLMGFITYRRKRSSTA